MDARLLKRIKFWYRSIAIHLAQHHPELIPAQIQNSVQQIILNHLIALLLRQRHLCHFHSTLVSYLQFSLVADLDSLLPTQLIQEAILDLSSFFVSEISIDLLGYCYESFLSSVGMDALDRNIAGHAAVSKQRKGVYYTPPAIVHYIINNTIPLYLRNSSVDTLPTILDPACGSGAFLLAAYHYLLTHPAFQPEKLTLADRSYILCHCIYGVDLDAKAIAITQLSLLLKLIENCPDATPENLPNLQHNIRQGNAIVAPDFVLQFPSANYTSTHPFDWHQAFPLIVPQNQISTHPEAGFDGAGFDGAGFDGAGFDIVIGNPPYIDSEWMTAHLSNWRQYCTQHYQTAKGNWDLFCIFIEKAIELCRPSGLISFVVPNKLASADYAAPARSLLTQQTQLLQIRDYSRVAIFAASVYPLIYIAQKTSSYPQTPIQYERMQTLETIADHFQLRTLNFQPARQEEGCTAETQRTQRMEEKTTRTFQSARQEDCTAETQRTQRISALSIQPSTPWLFLPDTHSTLMSRLNQSFPPLSTIAQVSAAATVSEAYALQSLLQDQPQPAPEDFKLINSGTIDRYCNLWGKKPCRYLGRSRLHPILPIANLAQLSPKRQQQTTQPKLILSGMTRHLEATLDHHGSYLAAKSTVILTPHPPIPLSPHLPISPPPHLRYLLALLNSRLLNFYFVHCCSGDRLQGGYCRVSPSQLRQLPIALPENANQNADERYEKMLTLIDRRLVFQQKMNALSIHSELEKLQASVNEIENAIDRLVYQLYELTDDEIEIVERSLLD